MTLICNSRCQYLATGAKMWMQEPNYCCRSHNVAAGAKICWQEIINSLSKWFCIFVAILVFSNSRSFEACFTLDLVLLGAKFDFFDLCML